MATIPKASPKVHLENGGVYFFKAPIVVTTQINHEILVVFTVPSIQSCGLVLMESELPQRVVEGMFDNLLSKISEDFKVPTGNIALKLFGQSFRRRRSLRYIESWSVANGVRISVMDVGKNVTRHIYIDCGTGKVGVSYAEGFTQEDPAFLSLGSVRLRESSGSAHREILVLSTSRVQRTLVKQAVEEHSGYRANCPKNPMQIIALNDFRDFKAETVMLFDDLEHPELLSTWVSNAINFFPSLKFCWVGNGEPLEALPRGTPSLFPAEPQNISRFKESLVAILPKRSQSSGQVIPFKK